MKMTRLSILIFLMCAILLCGLTGCATKYRSSQIDLQPHFIAKETIAWCEKNKCPDGVKYDLAKCQSNSTKQNFRNNLDGPLIKEGIADKVISGAMSAWKWIF